MSKPMCPCGGGPIRCKGKCARCGAREHYKKRRAAGYYQANKERLCAAKRRSRERTRAKELVRCKLYRMENAAQARERDRAYYERNREAILAKRRARREADPERAAQKSREYRQRLRDGMVQPHAHEQPHSYQQRLVRTGAHGWGARP